MSVVVSYFVSDAVLLFVQTQQHLLIYPMKQDYDWTHLQGDQIGRFFVNWATFEKLIAILTKNEVAQKFFLHFHLRKRF